jgi:hypothetical protein
MSIKLIKRNTIMKTSVHISNLSIAATSAALVSSLALGLFFAFEPAVTLGQETDDFTVRAQITEELSFITIADDITLTPPIPGLAGGFANGTTTVAVNTNNPDGYSMSIEFATGTAMQAEIGTSTIPNYAPVVGGTPDYNFTMASGNAGFGYSVFSNTNTEDTNSIFLNDGSVCSGGGTTGTLGKCWYNVGVGDASNATNIINRTSETPGTGATTTIAFQVGIGNNPSTNITTGFFNATTTLTITNN